MTLYKSFGNMESSDTYSPNASMPQSMPYSTPYSTSYSIPYSQPPPTSYSAPVGHTPIDNLPDMQNVIGGPYASSAIRNFGQPSYSSPPHPSSSSASVQQPTLPSYSDLLQLYLLNGAPKPEDNQCKSFAEHVKACSKCSRKYVVDTNSYVAIIIGLVLFVLFLLTKIIDKFG